jgi:redox-sensitive bicupin YhaK (pirin superfamily)
LKPEQCQAWVNSKWKFIPFPGQFSVKINNLGIERLAYLVVAKGAVEIEGKTVHERDGAAIADTDTLKVRALTDAEVVLVDTAP